MQTRPEPPRNRRTGAFLLAAAAAGIAALTLTPMPAADPLPVGCLICGSLGGVDFVLNVLLFMPLGVGAVMLFGRPPVAVVTGFLVTLTIEAIQWRLVPGRHASLGDLVANTTGSALGALLAVSGVRCIRATGGEAKRLSAGSALLASAVIGVTGALLRPVEPPGPQYVQWAPVRRGTVAFPGSLLSVALNDTSLKPADSLALDWIHDNLESEFTVRGQIESPGIRTSRMAFILRFASTNGEGLMLAQKGGKLLFRSHIAGAGLGLRSPIVALDNVFTESLYGDLDTILVEAISNRRAITVRSRHTDEASAVTMPRTVGFGWTLVSPREVALDPSWWPANALWLGALVFPVSFFSRRASHTGHGNARSLVLWMPIVLILVIVAGTSVALGLSVPGPGEWLGMLGGVATGWWIERFQTAGRI